MLRKSGEFDRGSPEHRAIEASKVILRKTAERWIVPAYALNILDVLQKTDGRTLAHTQPTIGRWNHPHLGALLRHDKKSVPSPTGYNGFYCDRADDSGRSGLPPVLGQSLGSRGETDSDGLRVSAASKDNELKGEMFRSDSERGTYPGPPPGPSPEQAEGWDREFYNNFLHQISHLAGPPSA